MLGLYIFVALAALTYLVATGVEVPQALILTLASAVGFIGSKLAR